jgi:hypothetical protein
LIDEIKESEMKGRGGMWNDCVTGEVHTGLWWGFLRERDHLEEPGVVGRIIVKGVFKSGMGAWTGNFLNSSGPVRYYSGPRSGWTLLHGGVSERVHSRAGITNWPKQQGECTQSTPDVARSIWFRLLIRES